MLRLRLCDCHSLLRPSLLLPLRCAIIIKRNNHHHQVVVLLLLLLHRCDLNVIQFMFLSLCSTCTDTDRLLLTIYTHLQTTYSRYG